MSIALEVAIPANLTHFNLHHQTANELKVEAAYLFPPSFVGFQGHFPGNPVLPAIVQLATVRSIAEKALGKLLKVKGYSHCKFKKMVKPDEEISFSLTFKEEEKSFRGKFKIQGPDQEKIAEGRFIFCERQ